MKNNRQHVQVFEAKCKTFEEASDIRDEYFAEHNASDVLLRIKWRKNGYTLKFLKPVNVKVEKQSWRCVKSA